MGLLPSGSARQKLTLGAAAERVVDAVQTDSGAEVAQVQIDIDPASLPTPEGDPAHESLVLRHGFYHFRDDYQLRKEPSVDQSVAAYLSEVEKAFLNRWNLHPNVILERTHDQKIKHAYDLDFRENEIKRIRSILPVDKDVFDYIDVLIDVVMLKNLQIYVAKRLHAFRATVRSVRIWFLVLLGLGLLGLGAATNPDVFAACSADPRGAVDSAKPCGTAIVKSVSAAAGIPLAVTAASVLAALLIAAARVWYVRVGLTLRNVKEDYEAGVRDATGLAALKLANKGRDVNDLMHYLKNRLETISSPDKERVEAAPKLIRILLWCPERMLLIENYYRAKMDQFNVKSALISLRSLVNTKGTIYNRVIFLAALGLLLVVGLGLVPNLNVTNVATHPAEVADPIPSDATLQSAVATGEDQQELWRSFAMAALLAFVFCAVSLNRLAGTFALHKTREEQNELIRNGLLSFLTAVSLALAPVVCVLVYGLNVANTMVAASLVYFFLLVWLLAPVVLAQLLFQTFENTYSSNVLTAVIRKMDSSQWTRYSDLRVDERVAEVFAAIYNAWFRESSKGIYNSGSSHNSAASPQRRNVKLDYP